MDVADNRFKAVFEDHDFAIDPTSAKYVPTEGMKKVLEEGRRKRKGDGEEEEGENGGGERSKRSKTDGDGLEGLLASVKKKARKLNR